MAISCTPSYETRQRILTHREVDQFRLTTNVIKSAEFSRNIIYSHTVVYSTMDKLLSDKCNQIKLANKFTANYKQVENLSCEQTL